MSKNVWTEAKQKKVKEIDKFAVSYMDFLNKGKTERECTDYIVNTIEAHGYKELKSLLDSGATIKTGDKIYAVNMNKSVLMFNIGEDSLESGMNILGAHIDSPRLDLKANPLYEDSEIAYFDTHYYGGVKKYQWVTLPLALHGVVVKKDGSTVEINIGEDQDDPVFFISDLLIHLAQDQLEKKASKVIEGEQLDVIIGSMPIAGDKDAKEAVKANILKILKSNYDIEEEDFHSAEIEVVPAGKAREAGFDRSMILGYGHDDRVCAYPSMVAMLEAGTCKKTSCCILVDKEEIGSVGATGMQSMFFENVVAEVLNLKGEYSDLALRRCLANSNMLSSDVSSAYDPTFASTFDKKNTNKLGHGIVLEKYTGARGKSGSNDANAEYLAMLRNVFEKNNVLYQTGELGKVDIGGGGTIAYILALYGMNVTDCGVPVLNMHAPWECISKADLYETKCGYVAFLKDAQ